MNRAGQVAQCRQTLFGHIQHLLAKGLWVLAQALQVILDAGDGIGQVVQVLPIRRCAVRQQVFANIAIAGFQQARRTVQGNHRQRPAHLGQQVRQQLQWLAIPVGIDVFDDHVLGLLQAKPGFLDDDLVDLRQVRGRQPAFFTALLDDADHARQGRLDVEQGAGDVHQDRIVRFALTLGQAHDHAQLVDDDLAWLAKTEHRQGVGDLSQRRQQAVEVRGMLAVAAHEQVQALLDPHQLLAQGGQHRAHGVTVRSGQARALRIQQGIVRQGVIQPVAIFHD